MVAPDTYTDVDVLALLRFEVRIRHEYGSRKVRPSNEQLTEIGGAEALAIVCLHVEEIGDLEHHPDLRTHLAICDTLLANGVVLKTVPTEGWNQEDTLPQREFVLQVQRQIRCLSIGEEGIRARPLRGVLGVAIPLQTIGHAVLMPGRQVELRGIAQFGTKRVVVSLCRLRVAETLFLDIQWRVVE